MVVYYTLKRSVSSIFLRNKKNSVKQSKSFDKVKEGEYNTNNVNIIERKGWLVVTNALLIKLALAKANMSASDLARRLNSKNYPMSKQTLGYKIKTDKFTTDELVTIFKVIGCEYKVSVVFPDGEEIK